MSNYFGKVTFIIAFAGLIWFSAAFSVTSEKAHAVMNTIVPPNTPKVLTKILAIPARRQWDDNEGYCGEACVQSFAMYYGTYVSQYQVRAMINPDQRHELVIGDNEKVVFKNLCLTYREWDEDKKQPQPQYQSYLAWTKQELSEGHPVIGTAYMKGETDPDFDHILPFIGFRSAHDTTSFHADDKLIYYDLYDQSQHIRPFNLMVAVRSEVEKQTYDYYIPRSRDYGCSITGIVDPRHETLPVQLSVDRWDEPDLIAGEKPVTMHGTLLITSLQPRRTYSLLRYDDYRKVPNGNFLAKGGYTWKYRFRPAGARHAFTDKFPSSGCVIYRCVAD